MNWHEIGDALYQTSISANIRHVYWLIPTIQSFHILAIGVLVGAALIMELRLAGVLAKDEPAANVVRRHLPWLYCSLAVLLVTGSANRKSMERVKN